MSSNYSYIFLISQYILQGNEFFNVTWPINKSS